MFVSFFLQWTRFSSADKELTEYAASVVNRAALDRRSARDLSILIQVKAEQLSIPLQPQQITITGQGQQLHVDMNYQAEIKIPVVDHALYRMEFHHNLVSKI